MINAVCFSRKCIHYIKTIISIFIRVLFCSYLRIRRQWGGTSLILMGKRDWVSLLSIIYACFDFLVVNQTALTHFKLLEIQRDKALEKDIFICMCVSASKQGVGLGWMEALKIWRLVVKTLKGVMGSNPYSRVPRVRLKMACTEPQQYTLLFFS